MALRRPLVRILGKLRILPAEDKIPFSTVDELGTAAKRNIGTSGTDAVPALGGFNTWSAAQTVRAATAAPLALERTGAAANVSISFTTTAGTTYFGFGPATLGDLYVGTTPNLANEGNKLLHTGNQLAIGTTAASARTALGLGTAATKNTGTAAGNVMEVGAGNLLANALLETTQSWNGCRFFGVQSTSDWSPSVGVACGWEAGYAEIRRFQFVIDTSGEAYFRYASDINATGGWKAIRHSGNTFTDASGVLTNTSGALTNFVSLFLRAATAAAGRTQLELGTAATATLTTSTLDSTAGRALKVGDAGILGAAAVTITDWNTATHNGAIMMASAGANAPTSGWYIGTYWKHNNIYGTQIVSTFTDAAPRIYVRTLVNNAWSGWVGLNTGSFVVAVSASRTLTLVDAGAYLRTTAATTITVPTNATAAFVVGTEITIRAAQASGNTTIAAASGVTLIAPAEGTLTLGPRMTVTLKKVGTDTWDVIGQTVPA